MTLDKDTYTLAEACEFFQINKATMWHWRKRGLIRASKIGDFKNGKVYFTKDELQRVLETNQQEKLPHWMKPNALPESPQS